MCASDFLCDVYRVVRLVLEVFPFCDPLPIGTVLVQGARVCVCKTYSLYSAYYLIDYVSMPRCHRQILKSFPLLTILALLPWAVISLYNSTFSLCCIYDGCNYRVCKL